MSLGVFTSYENAGIDSQISDRLKVITDNILRNVPHVRSVLLAGGFGKGEGSIEITQDGKVKFIRDFDMVVIVDRIPKETVVRKMYDQIYQSLELPNPESSHFRFLNFVVDIKFMRKKDLIFPDIWFYDLKVASKLLYGEDIREQIHSSKKEIPLSSGIRILFEKITGFLVLFPILESNKMPSGIQVPQRERELIIVECYKAIVELCTVLCILAGRYEPRYADRARILKEIYFIAFPDLADVLPDLPERVTKCTNFKLKPDLANVNEDVVDLWFSTREYLSTVLSFYIKRYLGKKSFDVANLPSYFDEMALTYYNSFLKSLIPLKSKSQNGTLVTFASFLYQILVNAEYSYVISRYSGKLYLEPLRKSNVSPSLKFFLAAQFLYLSLNRDGTVDEELLQKAESQLRHCIPVQNNTVTLSGWDHLRRLYYKAYSLCGGYHFVK